MKKTIAILSILALGFAACEDEGNPFEQNPPTITVAAPLDSAVYTVGDVLPIDVTFSDDSKVQAYTVNVKSQNSIFLYNGISDSLSVRFDTTITLNTQPGNYEVNLYCEDSRGNFKNKIVYFTVNQ